MFIAKFAQVSADSQKFIADKNENLPYIGEVFAGKATGTLVNGTMFERNGYSTDTLYACENIVEPYENPVTGVVTKQSRVQIVCKVSVIEYQILKKELGAPKFEPLTQDVPAKEGAPAFQA